MQLTLIYDTVILFPNTLLFYYFRGDRLVKVFSLLDVPKFLMEKHLLEIRYPTKIKWLNPLSLYSLVSFFFFEDLSYF